MRDRNADPISCDNAQLLGGTNRLMAWCLWVWSSEFGTGQCMRSVYRDLLASSQVAPYFVVLLS